MAQQYNTEERFKPFKYMAGLYLLSSSVRMIAKRRYKTNQFLKSPLFDFIGPFFIGAWAFSVQNNQRYQEYEKYSLKRIQNQKLQKEKQDASNESTENRKFWTNSQFWH